MRTRVKICGITRAADADHAVACGADALGFNFYPRSSRYVEPQAASDIVRTLPAFVVSIALFVDEDAARIREVLDAVPVDMIQFHGGEPAEFCRQFERPYMKALAVAEDVDLPAEAARYPDARALLLDTSHAGKFGGTGQTFDWSLVPGLSRPIVIAGGLNPDNVADAVKQLAPYAVDVSTGVESDRGIKDPVKVTAFCNAVRDADRHQEELV